MIENTKLIQIISRQTMPNLLAAMAVEPARIVHICTPSMKGVSAALTKAYREAGVKVDVQELAVDEKPLMPEMFAAVTQAIKGESAAVVNFTGGTKPMSIGAYGAANAARVPSFYVDTDRGEFLDGRTGQGLADFFPNGDLSLGQVNRQLTVNCIARANGVERVTGGLDWKPYAALADRRFSNMRNSPVIPLKFYFTVAIRSTLSMASENCCLCSSTNFNNFVGGYARFI